MYYPVEGYSIVTVRFSRAPSHLQGSYQSVTWRGQGSSGSGLRKGTWEGRTRAQETPHQRQKIKLECDNYSAVLVGLTMRYPRLIPKRGEMSNCVGPTCTMSMTKHLKSCQTMLKYKTTGNYADFSTQAVQREERIVEHFFRLSSFLFKWSIPVYTMTICTYTCTSCFKVSSRLKRVWRYTTQSPQVQRHKWCHS